MNRFVSEVRSSVIRPVFSCLLSFYCVNFSVQFVFVCKMGFTCIHLNVPGVRGPPLSLTIMPFTLLCDSFIGLRGTGERVRGPAYPSCRSH